LDKSGSVISPFVQIQSDILSKKKHLAYYIPLNICISNNSMEDNSSDKQKFTFFSSKTSRRYKCTSKNAF